MHKVISLFAGIVVVVAAWGGIVLWAAKTNVVAAEPNVRLYVTPATQIIAAGSTTVLQIRLSKSANSKVDYVKADMTFAAAYLEVISIGKQGSHFNARGGPSTSFSNTAGTLKVEGTGVLLNDAADVLVATINVKGKTAGTSSMSFAATTQAGDMTNGGHVNNDLEAKSGATLTVTNAPAKANSTAPSATSSTTPPVPTPTTPSGTTPSATNEEDLRGEDGETEPVSTLTAADTSNSFWNKYQWYILGAVIAHVVGVVAAAVIVFRAKIFKPSANHPDAQPISDDIEEEPTDVREVTDSIDLVVTAPETSEVAAAQPMAITPPAPVVTQEFQTTRNTTDYANLPDMFDLGEERLRKEGLSDMKPTQPPAAK